MRFAKHLVWFAVAGTAFFALAASSPQCARSTDYSVNPGLEAQSGGNPCVQACIDDYQTAKKAEQSRFKEAMAACNGDADCRQEVAIMHASIVGELAVDKDACIAECEHRQGGGTSGQ